MSKTQFSVTLTQEQFDKLAEKLKSMDLGPEYLQSGTLPKTSGVVLSYVVAGGDGNHVINFTVEEKPFFVPESAIKSHVDNMIYSAG